MLVTKNLKFSYNSSTEFSFPDMQCNASEALLITGNSGKGKTTLLHLLAGLLKPISGEISIDNIDISKLSESNLDQFRGKNIGLILQQSYFISSLSVQENLELASWLALGNKQKDKVKQLLIQLDIEKQSHKLPSQLSIGQQQRVSIARALMTNPKLILADEPTSSLDDENANKVASLLENLAKEYTTALVIVTHDQRLKEKFKNQLNLN